MSTSQPAAQPASPFANVADIIIAPNAAFDRLRAVPTWLWAFIAASVLAIIGSVLFGPAMIHAIQASLPAKLAASDAVTKLPPDQQQKVIAMQLTFSKVFVQIGLPILTPIIILIAGAIQGLIMMIANVVGRGDGSFKKFFALSVTVAVVGTGLNELVTGLIVLVRGANSFEEQSAVMGSMPNLGLLAPGVHGAMFGFLSALNPFSLWATALIALGMVRMARVSPAVAWAAAIVMLLVGALFAGFGAAQNG